jgi:hypothetical protein
MAHWLNGSPLIFICYLVVPVPWKVKAKVAYAGLGFLNYCRQKQRSVIKIKMKSKCDNVTMGQWDNGTMGQWDNGCKGSKNHKQGKQDPNLKFCCLNYQLTSKGS